MAKRIADEAIDAGIPDPVPARVVEIEQRPAAMKANGGLTLPLLQAGMVALQAMDVVSTRKALSHGGTYEANPVFGSIGGSLPAAIALKAGATAGIILLTQRLSKTNRVAAIATMVALNSAYATLAAHNYSVASHSGGR